jgi:hypothetical protein
MATTDEALKQIDLLIGEFDALKARARRSDMSDLKPQSPILANRLEAALDRLAPAGSTYARTVDAARARPWHLKINTLREIAGALREDIAAGWLTSVLELAHVDTYAGYLEMAEGLSRQGYKDAAAVIAGTSLEVHMKALATKHGISLQLQSGAPKKMDAVNAELKAAGVYNALEHKQVTAWLAIRNSAAHGDYGDYDETAVKAMVGGVGGFAGKYPA